MAKRSKYIEDKIQPASLEVEEIVLGTLIIDGNCIDRIISIFSINLFFKPQNKVIANSLIELYKSNSAIDLVTLVNHLKKNDNLGNSGGPSYIASLTSKVASSSHIDYHVRILQQEALRRNLIKIGNIAVQKSFDNTEDIFDVFNETQSELDNSLKNVVNYEIKSVGKVHDEIIQQSINILKLGKKSGVPTGLTLVDNLTNGWQKSDLVILAGRPGMGKSTVAVCMCIHPSVIQKIPVAIFSLEMSNEQIVSRMQSYFSAVNVSKIVKKQLTEQEIVEIEKTCKDLKTAPIFIDDTPNISLLELKGKCRKLVKENNVQLIVIDYLQLMRSGLNINNREQEIAEISRGLKALAKELKIPVIALSQLSRGVESRADKKPMLQDLRESGQIEQDADMVIFCFRPEYYEIDNYEVGSQLFETKGLFMLIIAKHRNGELGEIPLRFIHEQTKITNYNSNSFNSFQEKNSTFVQQDYNKSLNEYNSAKYIDIVDIFSKENQEDSPF
jgi:replicative DNA helicase